MKQFALGILLILFSIAAFAGSFDPALKGRWVMRVQKENMSANVLWDIDSQGQYSLTVMPEERGVFHANPESWEVVLANRPTPLSHGTISIKEADTFSVVFSGMVYEWILFKRIPTGNSPTNIPLSLLPKDMMTAQPGTPTMEFKSSLVGLWQASSTSNGSQMEMVWRINANGQSIRISTTLLEKGRIEATGGKLKMISEDGNESEGTYQLHGPDIMDMTDADQQARWTRFKN